MLPRIELVRATPEQQPIVANLMELYVHDFSEFYPIEPGPDGRFGYKDLALYRSDADRLPFLVRANGGWAGFVLIRREQAAAGAAAFWDLAEFFILRAWRRRSVGTVVAHQLWQRHPGQWQVRVMEANAAGCSFWENAVRTFAGDGARLDLCEKGGVQWRIFTFESRPGIGGSPAPG